MREIKLGSEYDEEWIGHQFKTLLLPYCNEHGESDDYKPAQEAFYRCLYERQAPMATIKYFLANLEGILKEKVDSKQPINAVKACIDYLNLQLREASKSQGIQIFSATLEVKGDSKDLEAIYTTFKLPESRMERQSNPADVSVSNEKMSEILSGKPMELGTPRLIIKFNGSVERLKKAIQTKFPNITFY
jgi:hypothetical protein